MPPVDWARPATPDADADADADAEADADADAEAEAEAGAEADGLAPEDVCEGPVAGAAVVCGTCGLRGTSPVKSEPRIRSTVPGVRLDTCREVTLVSSFMRVFTAGMSAVVE